MDYIKRITKFQRERGWTAHKMAVEAELNTSTVSNWFNRGATPTTDALEKLCVAFGITMSEFFKEKDGLEKTLTVEQNELLSQWNCLHKNEKDYFLKFITAINKNRQ